MTGAVVACFAGVALLAWLVRAARQSRAAFAEKFPPITDAEFLARCSPGVSPEVALKVRRIVARHLAVDYDRLHPSARFVDDLGAD